MYTTEKRLRVTSWTARTLVTDDNLKNHMLNTHITLCHGGDHVGLLLWDAEGISGSRVVTGLLDYKFVTKLASREIQKQFSKDCKEWRQSVGDHE